MQKPMTRVPAFIMFAASLLISSCISQKDQGIEARTTTEFVVIGYVSGFRGEIDETTIDATKLTHMKHQTPSI